MIPSTIRAAVALSTVLALGNLETGCRRGPAEPTSPPPAITTPPPPTPPPASGEFSLSGHVVDNVYRALADVRVEVVEGSRVGAVAMTNASGDFQLPGGFAGAIAVRASKGGYVTQTQTLTQPPLNSGRYQLGFILDRPSENFAGNYIVIVDADPACSALPQAARRRTYEATATPTGFPNSYRLALNDGRFSPNRNTIFALVSGDSVRFDIDPYDDLIVTEELTASTTLSFWGISAVETITPSIATSFEGEVVYCPDARGAGTTFPWVVCAVSPVDCSSSRHTLSIVRHR